LKTAIWVIVFLVKPPTALKTAVGVNKFYFVEYCYKRWRVRRNRCYI